MMVPNQDDPSGVGYTLWRWENASLYIHMEFRVAPVIERL